MKQPESVLIAGPVNDDSFAENLICTFRSMGIRPFYDEQATRQKPLGRLVGVARELAERAGVEWPEAHEKRLLRLARRYKPELFLSPTQSFSDLFLNEIRTCGVRHRVAWWGDPPAHMKRMGLLSKEWDLILFKDPDAAKKFRRVGLNAHLMHEAMNPVWHRPVAEQANQEVAIAGNFYGYRQFLVMELIHRAWRWGCMAGVCRDGSIRKFGGCTGVAISCGKRRAGCLAKLWRVSIPRRSPKATA